MLATACERAAPEVANIGALVQNSPRQRNSRTSLAHRFLCRCLYRSCYSTADATTAPPVEGRGLLSARSPRFPRRRQALPRSSGVSLGDSEALDRVRATSDRDTGAPGVRPQCAAQGCRVSSCSLVTPREGSLRALQGAFAVTRRGLRDLQQSWLPRAAGPHAAPRAPRGPQGSLVPETNFWRSLGPNRDNWTRGLPAARLPRQASAPYTHPPAEGLPPCRQQHRLQDMRRNAWLVKYEGRRPRA